MNKLGIVLKLGITIMGLLLIVLIPLGFTMDKIFSSLYFSNVREDIEQLSDKYAHSITNLDDEKILTMFENLAQYTNTHILIVNKEGKVVANSGIQEFPKETYINNSDWLTFKTTGIVSAEYMDPETKIHYLLEGRAIRSSDDEVIGGILILSSVSGVHESINQIRMWLVLIIIISIILSLGFTYVLSNKLSLPLLQMVDATRKIAKGHLETRVLIHSKDEIGSLASAINDLAVELKEYRSNRREFFANVSHELRTPITYLEGYAHLLKNKKFKNAEEEQHCIEIIEQEAKRMSALINDLFELSKMEEGKILLQFEWIDVQEVLESAIAKTKLKAKEKLLNLELKIEEVIPLIKADGVRLEQIFINLIENAIRYTEKGSVNVQLKFKNSQVIIMIQDTGPGIPKEDIPYIFERFYRVEKSRSRNLGGTGLGLAIVKNLVELHKGTIEVRSSLGQGTTFGIKLPAVQEE